MKSRSSNLSANAPSTAIGDHDTSVRLSGKSAAAKSKGSAEDPKGSGSQESNALLSSPYVGVVLIDDNRKIVSANEDSAAMFGWPNLLGKHVETVLQGGLNNEFGRILLQPAQSGNRTQRFTLRISALRKGGEPFPAAVILTRTTTGSKTSWTAVFQELAGHGDEDNQTTILRQFHPASLKKQCADAEAEAEAAREALEKSEAEAASLKTRLEELTASKADLESNLADAQTGRQNAETSLTEVKSELQRLTASKQETETTYMKEAAQCDRLKEELICLRQVCDQLTEQITQEQQESSHAKSASSAAQSRLQQVEFQLAAALQDTAQSQARLEQLTAQLEEKSAAFETLTADFAEAKLALEQRPASTAEPLTLSPDATPAELWSELRRLKDVEAELDADRANLENKVLEQTSGLARVTAELERERSERRRREQRSASLTMQLKDMAEDLKQHLESESAAQDRLSDLERRLRTSEEDAARLKADLHKESSDRQLAEDQLAAAGDMNTQLQRYQSLCEETKQSYNRAQEDLDKRLQSALKNLHETEAKLQTESAERQRFEETLATLQRDQQSHGEHSTQEIARLKSELHAEQLERKRLEGDAALSRYATLDSARVSRSQVSRLQRQLRKPAEDLLQSTRLLLEVDLPDDQKKLVESMLESALIVQSSLQESSPTPVPAAAPATPAPAEFQSPDPSHRQAA